MDNKKNNLLHAKIIEKYGTLYAFSQKINLSPQCVSYKLNGRRGFTSKDIKSWCAALEIDIDNSPAYFLK